MPSILPRSAWGARPPSSPLQRLVVPTPIVYVHHSASTAYGPDAIYDFQGYHMRSKEATPPGKGMRDIAYNFLIDHDLDDFYANIYTGRGFGYAHGGNTGTDNFISHSICLMGNFENEALPEPMHRSLVWLLQEGKKVGAWRLDDIRGHRQEPGASTACPGINVMRELPEIRTEAQAGPRPTPPPIILEDEMTIYDCVGKPALLYVNGTSFQINPAQRNWFRANEVPAKLIQATEWAVIDSLPNPS